jgi:hypothetical protein
MAEIEGYWQLCLFEYAMNYFQFFGADANFFGFDVASRAELHAEKTKKSPCNGLRGDRYCEVTAYQTEMLVVTLTLPLIECE